MSFFQNFFNDPAMSTASSSHPDGDDELEVFSNPTAYLMGMLVILMLYAGVLVRYRDVCKKSNFITSVNF